MSGGEAAFQARGSASSRNRPWPYELELLVGDPSDGGLRVGLMTREGLVGRRIKPLPPPNPSAQDYATSDVYEERSFAYRWPYLGFGDATEARVATPRYAWARNAWFAGAFRGLGPRWRQLTLPSTPAAPAGEHAGFVEALYTAGDVRLFALAGRFVRRWDGPTGPEQALSLDLGSGVFCESATRWECAGVGAQDALYLTDSSARLWRYQANAWTQLDLSATPGFALPAGSQDATGAGARFVCSTGRELWRAWGYRVAKCEADPAVAANWAASINVGDPTVPISGLCDLETRLVIFKQDGTVWGLMGGSGTGTAQDMTPHLRTTNSREHGKRPGIWLDPGTGTGAAYFRSGRSLIRVAAPGGAGISTQPVGPERLANNATPLRGPIEAVCGYGGWCAYAAQYNAQNGHGSLLQYGAWVPGGPLNMQEEEEGTSTFVEAWHGAVVDWPDRRPTSLWVTTLPSVCGDAPAAGNPILLAGFADGTYGWCRLPRDGPNPFSEHAHLAPGDFTDQAAFVRWPRGTLNMPGDTKLYLSAACTGPVLDAHRWVDFAYRVDAPDPIEAPTVAFRAPWLEMADHLNEQGKRVMFPTSTWGKVLEVEERYRVSVPADGPGYAPYDAWAALATPVVGALIVRQQVRPAFRIEYAWTSPCHERVARRDGASSRWTPAQVRNAVVRAAQDPGLVQLVLPYEVVGQFSLVEYVEQIPPSGRLRRRGLAFDLAITAVAYRTVSELQTWQHLADLGYTTWESLPGTSWDDLAAATGGAAPGVARRLPGSLRERRK